MSANENDIERSASEERRKIRKGIYILPNLLTSASLFGGFYAIIASIKGEYEFAAIIIVICACFDGLDGRVARMTGSTSKFGMEYDSLSDLVAFGAAPAILMHQWALSEFGRYGTLAAFIFLVCGALRLARYNVQTSMEVSKDFNGLPITIAASGVGTTIVFLYHTGHGDITKHITTLILVYTLSFLMVSNIKYYGFKEMGLSERKPFIFLVGVILLLLMVVAEPEKMLFLIAVVYIVSGPLGIILSSKRRKLAWISLADALHLKHK